MGAVLGSGRAGWPAQRHAPRGEGAEGKGGWRGKVRGQGAGARPAPGPGRAPVITPRSCRAPVGPQKGSSAGAALAPALCSRC